MSEVDDQPTAVSIPSNFRKFIQNNDECLDTTIHTITTTHWVHFTLVDRNEFTSRTFAMAEKRHFIFKTPFYDKIHPTILRLGFIYECMCVCESMIYWNYNLLFEQYIKVCVCVCVQKKDFLSSIFCCCCFSSRFLIVLLGNFERI